MKPVTIIIPVYNAFEVTLDCIRSVLSTIPREASVCVIDDASPEGDLQAYLPPEVLAHRQLRVLRNTSNLGFVGTCNRGMLLECQGDVILLNSDTIVTKQWVEKLQRAAYSRPRVATVTPLTNNGTLCSVPAFLENNTIPAGYTLDTFSTLVEQLSERAYVEVPTCVGFCTYITRAALTAVGVFDPVFQRGYGEENDLSLRAKAQGFVNIVDDATYVYHRGSMSFKESREALSTRNAAILRERYPTYEASVAAFCSANPLSRVHARIWNTLIKDFIGKKKGAVLHIVHNGPFTPRRHSLGGTEYHVQSIVQRESEFFHYTLSMDLESLLLTAVTEAGHQTIQFPKGALSEIVSREFFSLVHLHHSLGFDLPVLSRALKNHGNYIVSVHDYHLLCGGLWLVKPDGSVCDGVSCKSVCFGSEERGRELRSVARELLEGARRVLVFSESSRSILSNALGVNENVSRVQHGIDSPEHNPLPIPIRPGGATPLKILCLGTLTEHKGLSIIQAACSSLKSIDGTPVEWHFIGRDEKSVAGIIVHGPYTPSTLRAKMFEIGPHAVLLAPQCQETYSVTLDEAVWNGVPVICSPFGALAERVQEWGVGYVFDNSITGLHETLRTILLDWDGYTAHCRRAQRAPIRSIGEEVAEYAGMYAEMAKGCSVVGDALVRRFQPDLVGPPARSKKSAIRRWVANKLNELEAYSYAPLNK